MKTMEKNSYIYQVAKWLESGASLTSIQAIEFFGCTRLSAVIFRLRNEYDMPIKEELLNVKNRNGRTVQIARYQIEKEN
jgi:hypothetical protein